MRHTSGTVCIDGEALGKVTADSLARKGICSGPRRAWRVPEPDGPREPAHVDLPGRE